MFIHVSHRTEINQGGSAKWEYHDCGSRGRVAETANAKKPSPIDWKWPGAKIKVFDLWFRRRTGRERMGGPGVVILGDMNSVVVVDVSVVF